MTERPNKSAAMRVCDPDKKCYIPFYDQVLEMRAWKALGVLRSRLGLGNLSILRGFLPITNLFLQFFAKWLKLVTTSWKRLV